MSDSVLDLMFLHSDSSKLNCHVIHPSWRLTSNYAPLTITITIEEEHIMNTKLSLSKNSKQEEEFIKEVICVFKSLDTTNLVDHESLEQIVDNLATSIEQVWNSNARRVKIMKHSKIWWNEDCRWSLNTYRESRSLGDWKSFKSIVKTTKRAFFNSKIQEVANKSCWPWELMNWVNKCKLLAMEAIKYNNQPCLSLDSLWNTLYSSFNTALHCQVNTNILDEIKNKQTSTWAPFSKEEFKIALGSCNNLSTSGPDKLSWRHLKSILSDEVCITRVIKIDNACIDLGYWPNNFKLLLMVIIPKSNKLLYDSPKSFHPIVLLNTLGKIIKKIIGERLQFHVVSNNFIHPSQLGGLKFKSTTDVGVALTHIIWLGWTRNCLTSTLTFNIAQFFPFLNHCLLTRVIHKAGLDSRIVNFFSNYLINRKTSYKWNSFLSPIFNINVEVDQWSTLSSILSALYLSPFLYILEKRLKNFKIPISIISFVDDGLFISQDKSFDISNSRLFCSYNVITNLLDKFGLIVEYSKTKVFHFSRSQGLFNPLPLDLLPLGGFTLTPKSSWKYLGFIFDRKLIFHQHINFYSNKALSPVKCMKLLRNLSHGINPLQKYLLYRCCILLIALYGFQLWFYHHALLLYPLKALGKIQRRAAIWILGAFKTSLLEGIEMITGLIPIKLHLQKLGGKAQLQALALLPNHIIRSLIDSSFESPNNYHPFSLANITDHQRKKIKGHLVNINNRSHSLFLAFSPTHSELTPGSWIIDTFSDRFSFNFCMKGKSDKTCIYQLDSMVIEAFSSQSTAIVAADASIKNNIATSISHTHISNQPLIKTLHHAAFVTSTEAEIFAIRCSINQATAKLNVSKIVIITNSIHTARKYLTLPPICFKSN